MRRRVLITGLGAVTPIGNTVQESWQNAKDGVCGIAPITLFDVSAQKISLAAEVKNLDLTARLGKKEVRHMDRYTQLAMVAAEEAMACSGLDMAQEADPQRCGVLVSSGIGGLSSIEQSHARGVEKGFDRVSPFFIPMCISNMAAGQIAIKYGFQGHCSCVVTACASSANAVGDSFRLVRDGYAEVMVCGGAEAGITPLALGGFTSMQALHLGDDSKRASIPFDQERSGFVMGEGASILVLEEYEHAMARGATVYGEIVGYHANCDAYHITAPAPGGVGAAACMQAAIQDAGITPEQVDYVNAHGTSTPMNDKCETAAIYAVFGQRAEQLPVSSTKSMTGHMLGAAGATEAIFCVLALQDDFLPPTIGYACPDEACKLDVVPNVGRAAKLQYALSNSLGFGGHNASLVLKKWEG